VAFNNRVLENEERIAVYNADSAEFLAGFNFEESMFVAISLGG
jgi:hypothetical protein